ncbi:MAG TPA: cytochrome c biogenesis protein CcsA, partial [Chthonomonadales bacterium]|nr:cytochrome c biogenesis protein CcsA [Chthonomonadales bacterium]
MITIELSSLAFLCYLLSATSFAAAVLHVESRSGAGAARSMYARAFACAGALLQFGAIGALCITSRESPFASSFGTLSVAAWLIVLATLALDMRGSLPALDGSAVALGAAVLFWSVADSRSPVASTPVLKGSLVSLHVMSIVAGTALMAVAFAGAVIYLVQNSLLRQHRVSGVFRRLPPLETLDRVAFHAVSIALPLMTIGLCLGVARAFSGGLKQPPEAFLTDPHTIFSAVMWCLYVAYLCARLLAGWRGARLQYL